MIQNRLSGFDLLYIVFVCSDIGLRCVGGWFSVLCVYCGPKGKSV